MRASWPKMVRAKQPCRNCNNYASCVKLHSNQSIITTNTTILHVIIKLSTRGHHSGMQEKMSQVGPLLSSVLWGNTNSDLLGSDCCAWNYDIHVTSITGMRLLSLGICRGGRLRTRRSRGSLARSALAVAHAVHGDECDVTQLKQHTALMCL